MKNLNKNFKKVSFLLCFVLILIFTSNNNTFANFEIIESETPHDFTKGLLDEPGLILSNDLPINTYDNLLTDKNTIPANTDYLIEFAYPVNINEIFTKYEKVFSSRIIFTFIGGESKSLNITSLLKDGYNVVDFKNVTKITFERNSDGAMYLYELDFFGSYQKEIRIYDNAHSLTAETTHNSINLNWVNPHILGFENILLYLDGKLIKTFNSDVTSYEINNLQPNTNYQVELVARYDNGGLSNKETLSIVTDEVLPQQKDITKLTAKATHGRVDLNWNLPQVQDDFKHVNIYRGQVQEETTITAFQSIFTNVAKANDTELRKIFETNGTYFNDLTVEQENTYEYKLTAQNQDGTETKGLRTVVTVPKAADVNLIINDLNISKNEGFYKVSWKPSDTGKVAIYLDGNLYQTVNANLGQYLIPENEMVYSATNSPLVTTKYISDDGKEGLPQYPQKDTSIGGFTLPFDVKEFLKTIWELIILFEEWIIMAILIPIALSMRGFIVSSIERKENRGRTIKANARKIRR